MDLSHAMGKTAVFLMLLWTTAPAWGETPPPEAAPPASEPDSADVEKIREQYWARGRGQSIDVVQNRNHPRRHKVEVSVGAGILLGDPALSTKTFGLSAGYHLSELWSFHSEFFKTSVGPSSVLKALQDRGTSVDFSEPRSYLGAEARFSTVYGKFALIGNLVYFDACVAAGFGRMATEMGGSLAGTIGLGQRFHVGNSFSINLDYRLMGYRELIPGKIPAVSVGQVLGPRTNISHRIGLSLSFFFNFERSEAADK